MILDIILIVIVILSMLHGYKKGCISIIAKLVSVIIAFTLAYIFAQSVGEYISNTSVGDTIKTTIESEVAKGLTGTSVASVLSILQDKLEVSGGQVLADKIINCVFASLGFILTFIVVRIVLFIAQQILEAIFDLPILKSFNKLGGVLISGLLFVIEISIILAAISGMSALPFMSSVINCINNSIITKTIYENNLFADFILNKII